MGTILGTKESEQRRTERSASSLRPGMPFANGRIMLVIRLAVACSAMLSAAPGCGFHSSHPPGTNDSGAARSEVSVEVENHNWSDITVYLITTGLPQRLGMVTALGNANFVFPSHRLNTTAGVRLRALPVAGTPFTSETILVQPGQAITWTLENDLNVSSLSVY